MKRYLCILFLLFGCFIFRGDYASASGVDRLVEAVYTGAGDFSAAYTYDVTASVQPYKYGAKELDRMHGVDLYDSEARWYDSLLGRTSTMDPKSEKYYGFSPYLWCAGNIVRKLNKRPMRTTFKGNEIDNKLLLNPFKF